MLKKPILIASNILIAYVLFFVLSSSVLASPILRMGIIENPPLCNNNDGQGDGLAVDLLKIIAGRHDWKLKYEKHALFLVHTPLISRQHSIPGPATFHVFPIPSLVWIE